MSETGVVTFVYFNDLAGNQGVLFFPLPLEV